MATATQTAVELTCIDRESCTSPRFSPTILQEEEIFVPPGHSLPAVTESNEQAVQHLSGGRAIIVIIQLAGVSFITTYNTGLVTVALPAMAKSLDIPPSLLLWPVSAYTLAMATCLLPIGAVSDVIGTRVTNLIGCFFIAVFMVASGLSQTGVQFIVFRAMQGIAGAFAIPTALSIVSKSIESGKRRNMAFSTLGLAQVLGFSLGLVFGGLFVSGPGWRVGAYIGGAVGFLLFLVGIWAVPPDMNTHSKTTRWRRLVSEVDWAGACLASMSIALLSYVLA